jgi:predicted nucleotidyltransferase
MKIIQQQVKEQIVKTVVRSGNGGAVWVPKEWRGEEVVIIRPQKQKESVKEKIFRLLEPYLKEIIAVGVYGSYARGEQTKDSDVDVLVITRDKKIKIQKKEKKIDVTIVEFNALKRAIENQPVIYYQIIQEAKPVINKYVLEELKKIKVNRQGVKDYLHETKEHLKSNRELIELDKIEGEYVKSYSVIYSAVLRLRGLYIIKCIEEEKAFSKRNFKNWIISKGLKKKEFDECYNCYRLLRDDEKIKNVKIGLHSAEKILEIAENEINEREAKPHDQ